MKNSFYLAVKMRLLGETFYRFLFVVCILGFSITFTTPSIALITASAHSNSSASLVSSKPLTIAVASNFEYPLSQIVSQSKEWQNANIRIVTGSSGTLYSQIIHGAPFDVFLSADAERPKALHNKGLSFEPVNYAKGKLVIWPVTDDASNIDLLYKASKVAIANPQIAPFGKAALSFIKGLSNSNANDLDKLTAIESRLVFGANITQAFQFVDSGNAQVGLVAESLLLQALTLLKDAKYERYKLIEEGAYPAILQQAVVLKRSKQTNVALAFVEFMQSAPVQCQLLTLGYATLVEKAETHNCAVINDEQKMMNNKS